MACPDDARPEKNMENRPYLILWFAVALFALLGLWGFCQRKAAPPPTEAPTTRPLVERLRLERQRRLATPPAP